MLNHSCILCLDWVRSHPFTPMESRGAAPLTLAERVTASINAPGSLTDYSWDSSENLNSWGLNEVVLRFDRAYRGNLILLRMYPINQRISACLQDWDFVSTVVDDLVTLEEECKAELSLADSGVTPSGVSLRQMTILISGIRAELRLDRARLDCAIPFLVQRSRRSDRRILMQNCQRLYWQNRYCFEQVHCHSLPCRVLSRSAQSMRFGFQELGVGPAVHPGCPSCCLHGSLRLPAPYRADI